MKAMVTIKRVLDPYAKVQTLSDGSDIDTTGIKYDINPFDEIAMEEAVRLKEKGIVTEIVAVSIGKKDCEDQLRKALAMGADKAILLESDSIYDSIGIAEELKNIATEIEPDIILMGKQATDGDNNQAVQMLAAKLNWPQATFASKIDISGNDIKITRETDSGEEIVELSKPCVISADLRLNEPRYIPLPGIIKARTKPLENRKIESSYTPKTQTIAYKKPPQRESGIKVSNVDELISNLKSKGVLS